MRLNNKTKYVKIHEFKVADKLEIFGLWNKCDLSFVTDIGILSVRPLRSGIVSKRLNVSSYFLQRVVAPLF